MTDRLKAKADRAWLAGLGALRRDEATDSLRGLLLVYGLPLVALVGFAAHLSVNIPITDQWDMVSFLEKIYEGRVGLDDFFELHNEHRIVLPRLVIAALAFTTGWNVRAEIALGIVLAALGALGLVGLAQRNLKLGSFAQQRALFYLANLACAILYFSWVQHQNWLWGFQFPWFFINSCVILATWTLYLERWPYWWRFLAAAGLCLLASFSSAHGLFSWLAIAPAVFFSPPVGFSSAPNLRDRCVRLLSWVALFALTLGVYLINYQTPSKGYAEIYYVSSITDFLSFFFTCIGMTVFGKNAPVPVLMTVGCLIFGLYGGLSGYALARPRSRFSRVAIPWVCLGAHAMIFALVNAYGRSGAGLAQALEAGRYATANVFIPLAAVQLVALGLALLSENLRWRSQSVSSVSKRSPPRESQWLKRLIRWTAWAIAAAFIAVSFKAYSLALADATYGLDGKRVREKQALCLELFYYLSPEGLRACFFEDEGALQKNHIPRLNRMGLRHSPKDLALAPATLSIAARQSATVGPVKDIPPGKRAPIPAALAWNKDKVSFSGTFSLSASDPSRKVSPLANRPNPTMPTGMLWAFEDAAESTGVSSQPALPQRALNNALNNASNDAWPTFVAAAPLYPAAGRKVDIAPDANPVAARNLFVWSLPMRLEYFAPLMLPEGQPKGQPKSLRAYLYYPRQKQIIPTDLTVPLAPLAEWVQREQRLAWLESGQVISPQSREPYREIGPGGQLVLVAHADTQLVLPLREPRRQLTLGYGLMDEVWQQAAQNPRSDGVMFRIFAGTPTQPGPVLFEQWLNPVAQRRDRGEKTLTLSLAGLKADHLTLETTTGPRQSDAYDWSFWTNPVFQ